MTKLYGQHPFLFLSVSRAGSQLKIVRSVITGRQAKGWTQKDLATKICEKPQVVTEYEQGKAIPNQNVIGKIERAIGKQRKAQLIMNTE